ncbi:UDP-N-acetylmuramate dehydrogenase [Clostridium tarantellae]|uniref:UDP-N-acetylenolpyruvoylglucosamine reductase n=1 Tax=Clostridium tarantellae TaxID=39493 RepID=A0A6I1MIF8_9CLOT|nr:UDP-N-acetylmuramate dehydrogenase [Clostridium tarantellae]MPQ42694.1 UDP-N-acetylmuramate dehydrogenase [Clostridium tarantellae]
MNQYMEFSKLLYNFYKEEDVVLNSPMSEHIYFKVGGPVDILVTPTNEQQVADTIKLCKEHNVPYFILGNGSNLLVKDGGVDGVIIKFCKMNRIKIKNNEIIVESGALLSNVSKKALEHNLTGFEFACGIPGSIGGAVFMNAGAYNGEMANVIKEAQVIDSDGNITVLNKEELELGYRTSSAMKKGLIVLSATISLKEGSYNNIKEKIDDLTNKREEKQPLEFPSAGSTFKRPEGHFAGKLIQDSGLKGFSIGGAAVSQKHSGFVINKGGATAKDILDLIAHIQQAVKYKFDVELHTEVRIIGRE